MHKFFIILLIICCGLNSLAQQKPDSTENSASYSLGFEPAFVFVNCFKTDLEFKQARSKVGIELTPEIYAADRIIKHPGDKVSGFGIGLYGKLYLTPGKHPTMLSVGATYRDIHIRYNDIGFVPYQQNGLNYYRYTDFNDVLKIKNPLLSMTVSGRVANANDAFFLDLYLGFGYKFGSSSSKYSGYRTENEDILNYAYRGPTALAGFKLIINYKHVNP